MKHKKRQKRAEEWAAFREEHGLSDDTLKLAREIGYPLKLLREKLVDPAWADDLSVADRIAGLHRRWKERMAARQAGIAAGKLEPKKKKPKKPKYDPAWAKAKTLCRLNMEDIRMAKELGMNPKSLIKNIPSPSQPWKAPVKQWIRDLYRKRQQRRASKSSPPPEPPAEEAPPAWDHDRVVADWKENAERNDEENYRFLRSLKIRSYGFEPDEVMNGLHRQAFQIVDCTRCANCCKTTTPAFNKEDISRIAAHLNLSEEEFIEKYLERDSFTSAYKTTDTPCPFLGDDDRCTIYEIRPAVCRDYPHTDKPGRVFRTISTSNNTLVCPAVHWIVERMKEKAHG